MNKRSQSGTWRLSSTKAQVAVTGRGTVVTQPDRVSFSITLRELADRTADARDLVNEKSHRVLNILKGAGLDSESIKTTKLSYGTRTRWDEGESILLGQEAVQRVSVFYDTGEKNPAVDSLIDQLTAIDQIELGQLNFSVSRLEQYECEARELAYKDGLKKAEQYAQLAQTKVKGLQRASEHSHNHVGGFLGPQAAPAPLSRSKGTIVETGQNSVTVKVDLIYNLK